MNNIIPVSYTHLENGGMLDKDEIIRDLQHIGVTYGVDEEVIDSFLKDRHYGKAYTVAKGTEPVSGREGYVEYKFNTELKPRPKMNEEMCIRDSGHSPYRKNKKYRYYSSTSKNSCTYTDVYKRQKQLFLYFLFQ